jgi:hypothetical protein
MQPEKYSAEYMSGEEWTMNDTTAPFTKIFDTLWG